jgi:hypothetical protein
MKGRGGAWAALLVAVAAVATLPVAIVATRWSTGYELIHAAFAIPVAAALALVSLSLGSAERRGRKLRLEQDGPGAVVRLGRALAMFALCLASSGAVAVVVFGILTYLGER